MINTVATGGLREGVEGSSSDGQEAVDYEVPEKIKTLHHLALQYVNQVLVDNYVNDLYPL